MPTDLESLQRSRDALLAEAHELLDRDDDVSRSRFAQIEDQLAYLQRVRADRARLDAYTGGTACEGDGFDRDPLGDPADVHKARSNPWDGARNRASVSTHDTFCRALDAIAQVPGMSDRSREIATGKLETAFRDESGNPAGAVRVADVVLATTDPDYVSGFARWWRGEVDLATGEERAALRRVSDLTRAMSVGTTTAGGFMVPESLDPSLIIDGNGALSPVRQLAKVKTVATRSATFVLSSAVTGSWDGEAAEVSDDSPTLAEQEIVAHKRQTFIPYSIELELTASNLTDEIAKLFIDDKITAEASAFVTGTGTNQPNGFVTALTGGSSIVASATTDTFAVGDLYSVFEAVPVRYRDRATWLGNVTAINDVRQFGTAVTHAFSTDLTGSELGMRILGRPWMECSAMDSSITAAADNYYLVLADWENLYGIVDRVGLVIERVEHLVGSNGRPTGQRGAYGYSMSGGDVLVDRAGRLLNVT